MTEETLNKRSEAGGNTVRLVHITTVPETFIFLRGQVTYMKDRGFEVIAISSPGPDLAVFSEGEGYRAYPVDMPRRITPLRDLRAVYQTWRLLKRIRPHIVHSHTPKGGLIGMLGARLAGAPVRIYHVRGLPLETAQGMKRRLLSLSERVSCRLAHQVLCVSPSLRKLVTEEFCTCPSEKVKVLGRGSGNGVDAMDRFNPEHLDPDTRREMRRRLGIPEEARVIGYVGRIVRDKGIEELAGAWKSLRENYPDLHLLMAGYLEPEDPVSEEAKELIQTDPRVHVTGKMKDMPPYYAAMDVLAFPTYREGLPNVPLEASAMGLPVVASNATGCVDVIDEGVTGTLVPVRDAAALAAGLDRYLSDPGLRERHGRAAREMVLRNFLPETIWAALHHEYLRLLRERGLDIPAATQQT